MVKDQKKLNEINMLKALDLVAGFLGGRHLSKDMMETRKKLRIKEERRKQRIKCAILRRQAYLRKLFEQRRLEFRNKPHFANFVW